ncbi:hypothetical protein CAC42_4678 [Sphaceloma murrayae]|uniref:Uncharacterized protein n=1 Tax=Sphaceloma murrayae TaxID=2082308 RepID=A0A2K1QNL3_9PEZI|nr:hypothetical protein CAC42_4678 [Sphaceloma murrayae]
MLALMPSSAHMTDLRMASPTARGAILTPVPSSTTTTTSPLDNFHVAGSRQRTRPKLSLDTSTAADGYNTSTLSNSGSFRLEALSVVSPTSRNTFHNYHVPRSPLVLQSQSPRSALPCPDIRISSPPTESARSPLRVSVPTNYHYRPRSPSPRSPRSPSSPRRALPLDDPAHLRTRISKPKPAAPKPIMSTGPRLRNRKRVAFRPDLTETIQTNTYVTPHVSLLDSPSVDRAVLTLPSPTFVQAHVGTSPLPFAGRSEGRTESRWRAAIERMKGETEALVERAEREGREEAERWRCSGKRASLEGEGRDEDEESGCKRVRGLGL